MRTFTMMLMMMIIIIIFIIIMNFSYLGGVVVFICPSMFVFSAL